MSIIELQRTAELYSNDRLANTLQQGGDQIFTPELVHILATEGARRRAEEERLNQELIRRKAEQEGVAPDITTQLASDVRNLQGGIGGIPGEQAGMDVPGLDRGIPSADMSQMAQGPMPEQAQMMAARGGLVPGYHQGGDIPTHTHGDKYWQHKANESPSWMQEDPDAMAWLSSEREAEQSMGTAESDALREALREGLSENDRAIRGREARWSAAGFDPEKTPYSDIPGDQRTGPPLSSYFTGAGREYVPPEIKKLWQDYKKVREEVREDKSGEQWRAYTDAGVDLSDINSFMKTFYDWPDVPVDHLDLSGTVSPIRKATQRLPFMSGKEGKRYLAKLTDLPSATPIIDEAEVTDDKSDVGGPRSPDNPSSLREDQAKLDTSKSDNIFDQMHVAVKNWGDTIQDRTDFDVSRRDTLEEVRRQVHEEAGHRQSEVDTLLETIEPLGTGGKDKIDLGFLLGLPHGEILTEAQRQAKEKQDRMNQERIQFKIDMKEIWKKGATSRKEINAANNMLNKLEETIELERITKGEERARQLLSDSIGIWTLAAREAGLSERLSVELANALKIVSQEVESRLEAARIGADGRVSGTSMFDPNMISGMLESLRTAKENFDIGSEQYIKVENLGKSYVNILEKLMQLGAASEFEEFGIGTEDFESILGMTTAP